MYTGAICKRIRTFWKKTIFGNKDELQFRVHDRKIEIMSLLGNKAKQFHPYSELLKA